MFVELVRDPWSYISDGLIRVIICAMLGSWFHCGHHLSLIGIEVEIAALPNLEALATFNYHTDALKNQLIAHELVRWKMQFSEKVPGLSFALMACFSLLQLSLSSIGLLLFLFVISST